MIRIVAAEQSLGSILRFPRICAKIRQSFCWFGRVCATTIHANTSWDVVCQNKPHFRRAALKILVEIIGWVAAAMMLSAYVLLTTGRLSSRSQLYQWLNVLSGAGFIVNSGWNGAYPSAFINVMWMAIGLYGVFRGTRVYPRPAD
jgi:hypothetical protein